MFPGEDPLGRRLLDFGYDPLEEAAPAFTIVGVVGDVTAAARAQGGSFFLLVS